MPVDYVSMDSVLCRKHLLNFAHMPYRAQSYEQTPNVEWARILGMSDYWQDVRTAEYVRAFETLLAGIMAPGGSVALMILQVSGELHAYIGCDQDALSTFVGAISGALPGVDVQPLESHEAPPTGNLCAVGGVITGYPTRHEDSARMMPIDQILSGMRGLDFCFVMLAKKRSALDAQLALAGIQSEQFRFSGELSMQRQEVGDQSRSFTNHAAKRYIEDLDLLAAMFREASTTGLWEAMGYYAAPTMAAADRLSALITMTFNEDTQRVTEGVVCRMLNFEGLNYGLVDVISGLCTIADVDPLLNEHPLRWIGHQGRQFPLVEHTCRTMIGSRLLAMFFSLPLKEWPGFYLDQYVMFDLATRPTKRAQDFTIGLITHPGRTEHQITAFPYLIDVQDFKRHALIVGITGGGKTNTAKGVLLNLWKGGIPFLVIESAKREYWTLAGQSLPELRLFTLGDEHPRTGVPYRLNPFEVPAGAPLQTHIDSLLASFKAAFELYPPMPYVLEAAVYEVYEDRGFDITTGENRFDLTRYPMLQDLLDKIDIVTDRLGYHNEVQSNVKAALRARIQSLMVGGKGAMLNTPTSFPIERLLDAPTVLELEDLGDDDTKAFVIGMLLVQLYEYRKAASTQIDHPLEHVLLVEEAHRLLKQMAKTGEGDHSRVKAVEFFCNLLSEIRSYGQGILIADQIPTRLAEDAIKNTNLKIIHRTVMQEDREAVGRAMNMTDEQMAYLSSLPRGVAAVYAEGDNRPKLVRMPLLQTSTARPRPDIIADIQHRTASEQHAPMVNRSVACRWCEHPCAHFEYIQSIARPEHVQHYVRWMENEKEFGVCPKNLGRVLAGLRESALARALSNEEKICLAGIALDEAKLSPSQRTEQMARYVKMILSAQ